MRKCTGKNSKKVDMAKTCKVKMITHFTDDMKKVKDLIGGLSWPQGSTLTSLALQTAKAELSLGRKNSKSIVVVITDGRPLSYRNTGLASRNVRKSARLVWVPVTRYAPLKMTCLIFESALMLPSLRQKYRVFLYTSIVFWVPVYTFPVPMISGVPLTFL